MCIEHKIKYIEDYPGIVWELGYGDYDWINATSLPGMLENKGFINEKTFNKLSKLRTNFYEYSRENEKLNSDSILLINLVYKILKQKEK